MINPEELPPEVYAKYQRKITLYRKRRYQRIEDIRAEFRKRKVASVESWVVDAVLRCKVAGKWTAAGAVDAWLDGRAVQR